MTISGVHKSMCDGSNPFFDGRKSMCEARMTISGVRKSVCDGSNPFFDGRKSVREARMTIFGDRKTVCDRRSPFFGGHKTFEIKILRFITGQTHPSGHEWMQDIPNCWDQGGSLRSDICTQARNWDMTEGIGAIVCIRFVCHLAGAEVILKDLTVRSSVTGKSSLVTAAEAPVRS
jgi:hypothetical protein